MSKLAVSPRRGRQFVVPVGAAAAVAVFTAVSAAFVGVAAAANSTTATTAGPSPAAFAPAASGTIASISGTILEVQDPESGQTTVDLSAKTTITATVSVKSSSVKSGACITATGTKTGTNELRALSVTLEPAVKGKCTGAVGGRGFGGFGRGGGSGGGGFTRGTGGSGTRPPTSARPANFATASGKVTKMSGSTVSVEGFIFSFTGAPTRGTTTRTAPKTVAVKVMVSSSTRYSKFETVKASSLKVGECATAFGSTNDIGAVTATRLSVSQPTAGSCTGGFGGFGGRGGGAA